jgi:TfoX/Sxy family transcriptional regulator of competence genes
LRKAQGTSRPLIDGADLVGGSGRVDCLPDKGGPTGDSMRRDPQVQRAHALGPFRRQLRTGWTRTLGAPRTPWVDRRLQRSRCRSRRQANCKRDGSTTLEPARRPGGALFEAAETFRGGQRRVSSLPVLLPVPTPADHRTGRSRPPRWTDRRCPHPIGSLIGRVSSADLPYDRTMAYDEDLALRIRELVGGQSAVSERKMFGGLAFLIGGNMAVAASGQGGVMVRVDPTQSDRLVASTGACCVEMRGRLMPGWLRVRAEDIRTKRQLAKWVQLGTTYARSLPVDHLPMASSSSIPRSRAGRSVRRAG